LAQKSNCLTNSDYAAGRRRKEETRRCNNCSSEAKAELDHHQQKKKETQTNQHKIESLKKNKFEPTTQTPTTNKKYNKP
jgi:hypothetical protein